MDIRADYANENLADIITASVLSLKMKVIQYFGVYAAGNNQICQEVLAPLKLRSYPGGSFIQNLE